MMREATGYSGYNRAERLSDAAVHITGVVAAVVAVPVLVALAAVWRGDALSVIGVLVYGVSLIFMMLFSALYHMVPAPDWKDFLRRLDHSAIYLKIAGTYTPLVLLTGSPAAGLLTGIWGAALAGLSLKIVSPDRFRWLGLVLYLGMGWVGVLAGGAMLDAMHPAALVLVIVGGLLYTLGVAFFLWEMLPFHNTIWHLFVLIASVVFYAAIAVQIADVADLPLI